MLPCRRPVGAAQRQMLGAAQQQLQTMGAALLGAAQQHPTSAAVQFLQRGLVATKQQQHSSLSLVGLTVSWHDSDCNYILHSTEFTHELIIWIHIWLHNHEFNGMNSYRNLWMNWHMISWYSSMNSLYYSHMNSWIQDFMIMNSYPAFHDQWIQVWIHIHEEYHDWNHTWNHDVMRCLKVTGKVNSLTFYLRYV